jgi:hypothetical protein
MLKGFGYAALLTPPGCNPDDGLLFQINSGTTSLGQAYGITMMGVWFEIMDSLDGERPELEEAIGFASSQRPAVLVVLRGGLISPDKAVQTSVLADLVAAGIGLVNLNYELVPA